MSNMLLAEKILAEAYAVGVRDFCVCAGARNSPFVYLLDQVKAEGKIRVYSFFEERSAAFFALGRIERENRPVAVITTSGTAAAELLPATIEAFYTAKPLMLITADRPACYRGAGAPQSIEQVGIFSTFVERVLDIEDESQISHFSDWKKTSPFHVNVCFEEPLIDSRVKEIKFEERPFKKSKLSQVSENLKLDCPIVILGSLPEDAREPVLKRLVQLAKKGKFCIYAEAISGLRSEIFSHSELKKFLIQGGELSVNKIVSDPNLVKSVLRIGGVPTLRFWRDLEGKYSKMPVVSISETKFSGLSRKSLHIQGYENLESVLGMVEKSPEEYDFSKEDSLYQKRLELACEKNPLSESSLIRKLSHLISEQAVYLGNSLPIREWDLVSSYTKTPKRIFANRGANGIDGQISTFLGWAQGHNSSEENWAIVGDLTAMYDLAALWATPYLENATCRIVIINNKGGHIFKNMFQHEAFLSRHQLGFENWAKMWGWDYIQWNDVPNNESSRRGLPQKCIIEINPDEKQTEQFWQEYKST